MSEAQTTRILSVTQRFKKRLSTIVVLIAITSSSALALPTPSAHAATCAQPAHAWFSPSTVSFGGTIFLAAVAFPDTSVEFRFKLPHQGAVASASIGPAHSNCVVDHQFFQVFLPPGEYGVRASFTDENGVLQDVRVGSLTVTP